MDFILAYENIIVFCRFVSMSFSSYDYYTLIRRRQHLKHDAINDYD